MYFIEIGIVSVLAQNGKDVLQPLGTAILSFEHEYLSCIFIYETERINN